MMKKEPLTQSLWLIGTLCFFCFPAGLFYLWRHPLWRKEVKWVVTGIVAVLWYMVIVSVTNPFEHGKPTALPMTPAGTSSPGTQHKGHP